MSASLFDMVSVTAVSLTYLADVFPVAEGQYFQEEAGERMGVSRGAAWRPLRSARKKTTQTLKEGRPVLIASEGSHKEDQGGWA